MPSGWELRLYLETYVLAFITIPIRHEYKKERINKVNNNVTYE
jgi:hypothetical protein